MQSLALELRKTKGGEAIAAREARLPPSPASAPLPWRAREITAIAKVTAVDPKGKTISLRGPRGNTVKLDVQNPSSSRW
jgi:hypothetical protein